MQICIHPSSERHNQKNEFYAGELSPNNEISKRIDVIHEGLKKHFGELNYIDIESCDESLIHEIHDENYINFLKSREQHLSPGQDQFPYDIPYTKTLGANVNHDKLAGIYCSDTYTAFTKEIWDVAKIGYDVVHSAGKHVLQKGGWAYALTRPPGHHAMKAMASGTCYLANASIFANYLTKLGKNVTILDIDYHHGNGAQMIFYERDDVLTISLHRDPYDKFPYFTGREDEIGEGDGKGYNKNIIMPKGTSDEEYISKLNQAIDTIKSSDSQFLVVSVGFDIHENDVLGDFDITNDGLYQIGKLISQIKLPKLFVQEGGYTLSDLGGCASSFFAGVGEGE